MLHFFPFYATSRDVEHTPFGAELRRQQVAHRFFGNMVNRRYQTTFSLLCSVYPRLLRSAVRSAIVSLLLCRPRPDAAIVGTDVEALIFGLLRWRFRLQTLIVFETLIISPKNSRLLQAIHTRYYSLILSLIDLGICHSKAEVASNTAAFPHARGRFAFIPFGTTVTGRKQLMAIQDKPGGNVIVAAGSSSRDYLTLAKAIQGLPCELHIICHTGVAGVPVEQSDQIRVIRDCFDQAYIEAVAQALFVVVPLAVDHISAGQMVLLQAAALGKAIIVTRTATTLDYATDQEDALFTAIGDVGQMRNAVRRLLDDAALRARLGANAAARFEREHTTEAYVRKLLIEIDLAQLNRACSPK